MARLWPKLLHLLDLARLDTVLAAVSNIWLVIFLANHFEPLRNRNPELPDFLPFALIVGAALGAGLSGYGTALNDILDRRRDRAFRADRPLASGQLQLTTAVIVAVCSLLIALLAAAWLGKVATVLALGAALAILLFNAAARFVPAVGVILLGLIWALSMLIVNPHISFAWPAWVVMSHVTITATLAHRLQGKRPALRHKDMVAIVAGYIFWTLVLIGWMSMRAEAGPTMPHRGPWMWLLVLAAGAGFVLVAMVQFQLHRGSARQTRQAGAALGRLSLRWMSIYGAAWLFGAGIPLGGTLLLSLFVASWLLSAALRWLHPTHTRLPAFHLGTSADRLAARG